MTAGLTAAGLTAAGLVAAGSATAAAAATGVAEGTAVGLAAAAAATWVAAAAEETGAGLAAVAGLAAAAASLAAKAEARVVQAARGWRHSHELAKGLDLRGVSHLLCLESSTLLRQGLDLLRETACRRRRRCHVAQHAEGGEPLEQQKEALRGRARK